jgi:hypothetical protein
MVSRARTAERDATTTSGVTFRSLLSGGGQLSTPAVFIAP